MADGDTPGLPDDARDYVAALSHELRTPLGGVLGMAGLLELTRLDPNQQTYVRAIRESGEHLLSLVNDILDLARLGAVPAATRFEPCDVETLLQSVCELLGPRANEKGLEIAWAADRPLPRILADEGKLRQILFNLAGNGVKYTSHGGVLITADPGEIENGELTLRFNIADTGPGVPREERARIFEPFVCGSGALRPASTGLGLAVVKRLAVALGGKVGLETRMGEGSTFWFEAAFPVFEPAGGGKELSGKTVAVVSPDPVVRRAVSLHVAASGGAAIAYASRAEAADGPACDVVLKDDVRRENHVLSPVPGAPNIVLLRPSERDCIAERRTAGFAGYLIKPLRRASVVDRVLAASGEAPRPAASPANIADAPAPAVRTRPLRVLLAEDNDINAVLATALLQREGCEVRRAHTGPETVGAALTGVYDLILMDLRLPGMDGQEATRRLRAAGVTTPISALTANAFDDDRRESLAAGMDAFLTKPLEPDTLSGLIGRLRGFTDGAGEAKLAS